MIVDEKEFEDILKKDQVDLKKYLIKKLDSDNYMDVISEDGFIYAKGNEPYILVAHMDRYPTLSKEVITINKDKKDEYGRIKWSSPEGIAGDDRCGIYIILALIKKYHPSILFCEDEEIGCVGSGKFIKTKHIEDLKGMNYFIQIDRGHCHKNIYGGYNDMGIDVVFYNVNNEKFQNKICDLTNYKIGKGSNTDIVRLTEATNVPSFNISCGYFNEHKLEEYIILEEMINCYNAVENVIKNFNEKYYAFE